MISFAVNQKAGKKIPLRLWRQWLKKIDQILKLKGRTEISLALVAEPAIKKLNLVYRGKNQATDVLSFGERKKPLKAKEILPSYLGEIIICYPQAAKQAKIAGQNVSVEIELLLTHGFLHLLGYNHEKTGEARVMEKKQREILDY